MTWEPTNELRWLQSGMMMVVSGNINDPSYAVPANPPRLQQKWVRKGGPSEAIPGHVYPDQFRGRDVPLTVEE